MDFNKETVEYSRKNSGILKDTVVLNCARNCLRYVIKAFEIKEIFLPYYTCPVVWKAAKKEGCKIKFYHIGKDFLPTTEFEKQDFVVYTNYFGICAKNVKLLSEKYKNLIVDNAQAFYMPKYGIASFNSLRKFFALSDGAVLYTDKFIDEELEDAGAYENISYLLKKYDLYTKDGYEDFCKNEIRMENESLKKVSVQTRAMFEQIDIENAKQKRLENFYYIHKMLCEKNQLEINLDIDDVPMVYPFLSKNENCRKLLEQNNIYVPQYWNPMAENSIESEFQKYLLPLPINQRYSKKEMEFIAGVLNI